MPVSKKLDRLLKKNIDNYDAAYLDENSGALNIPTSEFNLFLAAVDQAFESAEIKTQQAERSLELSSKELAESNQKLFNMNNTMNTILNSLEEGLVLFDQTGMCSRFSSTASEKHFAKQFSQEDVPFAELFQDNPSLKADITEWIDLLFSGRFDFYQIHELGPNWVQTLEDKKIEILYKPVYNLEKNLEQVLVITKDVTAQIKAQQEADNQKNMAKTIIEICNSPRLFQDMLESVHHLNTEMKTLFISYQNAWTPERDNTFKRLLHTVKGATSSFNLKAVVEKIHHYEEKYAEAFEPKERAQLINSITAFIETSCHQISSQYGFILKKLLEDQEQGGSLNSQKKKEFLSELIQYNQFELIESFKQKFILSDFKDLFAGYDNLVEKLAVELHKNILPMRMISDSIYVLTDNYKDLSSSLVHVFRNMCDHGIETPAIREALGKTPHGQILVNCKKKDNFIYLKISDDGSGISKTRILEKIKGTPLEQKYAGSEDLLKCIFEPNFSTKEHATELSGRGVGLNAVYHEVKKLGGRIEVSSIENVGTSFEFILPVIDMVEFSQNQNGLTKAS